MQQLIEQPLEELVLREADGRRFRASRGFQFNFQGPSLRSDGQVFYPPIKNPTSPRTVPPPSRPRTFPPFPPVVSQASLSYVYINPPMMRPLQYHHLSKFVGDGKSVKKRKWEINRGRGHKEVAPPKWYAPSFCIAENPSDFDIPIPPPTPIGARYLPPVASERLQAFIGKLQREKKVDALLRIIPATQKPRWVAPSFPFAPKPKPAPYEKKRFRNDKRRLGKSYLCPHCFDYVVVGYQTQQQGEALWKVPMWNAPITKVLLYELLGATPTWKQVLGPRVVQTVLGENGNYATIGSNLGENEYMVPEIRKVKGVFHRLNHECTVGCIVGESKSNVRVVVNVKAATA